MRGSERDATPGAEAAASEGSSNRRRWIAAGAVTVAAVAAAGVASTSLGDSGDAETAQAATQSTATTKIIKQDLVEQETVDGTLGYSDARAVINRLSGTVTWTPRVGSVVETNHRLYEVDGKAVYLLDGAYPAYRTLQSGTKGDDVLALERNLRALALDTGHDMAVDGTWDSGTTAAVKRWQDRKGLEETGSIEKGRIVFQPGARRIGDVALRAGESASGSGGGGASNAPASTKNTTAVLQNASATVGDDAVLRTAALREPDSLDAGEDRSEAPSAAMTIAVRAQVPDATTPTSPTPSPTPSATPSEPRPQSPEPTATPRAASPQAPSAAPSQARPAQSGGSGGGGSAGGSGGAPAGGSGASAGSTGGSAAADVSSTLMTTTSVKRIVAVDLEATKQSLAKRGGEVSVELPDGKDVDGTIATISKVAQKKAASGDEDPPATIKVVIKLKRSAGTGLDQAPVDVSLEKTRAKSVLTVPVTALIARQGGSFAVEVRDGTSRKIVEVETGLYTDSYVEIEGAGLAAGMSVTNARV